jgi:hypothetical protein
MGRAAKILLLLCCEALLCGFVAAAFWYQDLRYSLPTPAPADLAQPPLGEQLTLAPPLATLLDRGDSTEPCLVHFFNPSCPCSRFNIDHVRHLVARFGEQVRIVAVLEGDDAEASLAAFTKLDVGIAAVPDVDGKIAASLGVFATPQAVVLDRDGRLIFRGNYNASRYCVNRETEFARLAIECCLAGEPTPDWPATATVAQGCELPANIGKASKEVVP